MDLLVSVVQQTLDCRSLNSRIRTFQVRPHNWDRIFLADGTDDVDRFRLDFAVFILEQSRYFLQFFGIRARDKKLQRSTPDQRRGMAQEAERKTRHDHFGIQLLCQFETE